MEKSFPSASDFGRELTLAQRELYTYIFALLGDATAAKDVLQETNIALWQHSADYDAARPFLPWAKAFAFEQMRKYRLYDKRLNGHVVFDTPTFEAVAATLTVEPENDSVVLGLLKECLASMDSLDRKCLELKYLDAKPVKEIARELGLSAGAVASRLFRGRLALGAAMTKALRE